MRVLKKRMARRVNMTYYRKQTIDRLLYEAVSNVVHFKVLRNGVGREIVSLLNQGAVLSINPKTYGNIAMLVNMLDDNLTMTRERRIYYILNNFVSSACSSWFLHLNDIGNGRQSLPYFMKLSFLSGMNYFGPGETQSWSVRHRSWILFRRMVWSWEYRKKSYIDEYTYPIHFAHFPGFQTALHMVRERIALENRRNGLAFPSKQDIEMFTTYAKFIRPRALYYDLDKFDVLYKTEPMPKDLSCIKLLWMMKGTPLFHRYINSPEIVPCRLLDTLSRDQQHRAFTLMLIRHPFWQEWFLRDDILFELCRRKERKIFEALLKYNRRAMVPRIPKALKILNSSQVRGCKQRLINELTDTYRSHLAKVQKGY